MPTPERETSLNRSPELPNVIHITGNPARRLTAIIENGNLAGPEEFLVKAVRVFEEALKPGAKGRIIVENEKEGLRYTYDIRHQEKKRPRIWPNFPFMHSPHRPKK